VFLLATRGVEKNAELEPTWRNVDAHHELGGAMVKFSSDPDALAAAAEQLAALSDEAESFTDTCEADAGHADLSAAISEMLAKVATSWSEQVAEVGEIATRLKLTSDLYRRADEDSAPRVEGVAP
jgi:hypothetical protein